MALDFRRGVEAIREAQESQGTGFSPWVPQIRWTEDKEERYILFLTPVEEVPIVDLHEFVPLGNAEKQDGSSYTKYGFYISPKDQAIGGDFDPLEELGFKARSRGLAVAVELEPIMEKKGNRQRPKGFSVLTEEFERKGDDEQTEKVTRPLIGLVTQAPSNFFGFLGSFEESEGPVVETAFKVKRRGKGKDTEYDFTPYFDQPVDLSNLINNLDGITYLSDELDEIVEAIEKMEEDSASWTIAEYLLNARLEELADGEQLAKDIEEADAATLKPRYGDTSKSDKKNGSRPARKSQRSQEEEPEDEEESVPASQSPAKKSKFEEMRKRAAARKADSSDE